MEKKYEVKPQKTDRNKMKDWNSKPQSNEIRTPPKWNSPHGFPTSSTPVSELEQLQLGKTSFYIRYSCIVPRLNEKEFEDLCDDIVTKGVLVPIIVDEQSIVIDGEHRLRAAVQLGLKQIPIQVRPGLTEEEKWAMAEDLNLKRRHLTHDQINQIIMENKERLPQLALQLRQEGKSFREIGQQLGISHQQASNLIKEETAVKDLTVKLPEQIVGKDGKKHPAKKPVINVNTTRELERAVDACQKIGSENLPQKPLDLKRTERLAREAEKEMLRQQEVNDFKSGQIELLQGNFSEKAQGIAENSVDLIFTDPPYDRESLPLWDQLGQLANRVLKPGGLLVSYTGSIYLNQIYPMLDNHLSYLWTAAIYHSGGKKKIHSVGLIQCWKPILIYVKEPKSIYWPAVMDMVSGGESKEHHDWEQSIGEALHYIKAFCPKNGTLLDPMMGSGTSVIAGLESGLGLKCIGIELDKATFIETEQRIQKRLT